MSDQPAAPPTPTPTKSFHTRGAVVFFIGLVAAVLLISGIVLFIAPSGRIAHGTRWTLLWLDKNTWVNLHNAFAFLFVVGLLWHLTINWKPLAHYIVSRTTHRLNLTREMLAAAAVVLVVILLVVLKTPPVDGLAYLSSYFRHEFWK